MQVIFSNISIDFFKIATIYRRSCITTFGTRLVPIMLLKLPIKLWSNAVHSCLLCLNYAPQFNHIALHKFDLFLSLISHDLQNLTCYIKHHQSFSFLYSIKFLVHKSHLWSILICYLKWSCKCLWIQPSNCYDSSMS